jgi:WXXGXW repeat (2 copies)
MKKSFFAALAISGLLFFSSCGPGAITVTARPESPFYTRPASPGVGYVWIDGDWVVRGGHYQWREGYWRRPGTRVWITGSWESRNNGWYWRKGHWRR